MRIIVKEEDHNIRLSLPTGLFLNRCTAGIASREAEKYGVKLSPRQMRQLFQAIKDYRRTHPEWVLAEVKGAKGEYVYVKF